MEREKQPKVAHLSSNNFEVDQQSDIFSVAKNKRLRVLKHFFIILAAILVLSTSIVSAMLVNNPQNAAKQLGLSYNNNINSQTSELDLSSGESENQVDLASASELSIWQQILSPIVGLSLQVVKIISPDTYSLLNPLNCQLAAGSNKIFSIRSNNTITPNLTFTFPDTSYFAIPDSKLINNLNAEYVSGRKPGLEAGDLVFYNEAGKISADKIDGNLESSGAIAINSNGGIQNNNGLSLKTSCSAQQILVWNGKAWVCADHASSTSLSAAAPLVYDQASGVLSFNFDTSKWDVSYNHLSDTANPHHTTANQVLPDQNGESGKVLGTDGSNVSWVMNSATTLWGAITGTLNDQTDLVDALADKEDALGSGNASQYLRGDKTWQTLNNTSVGLGNVDNTSDANKPLSNATQLALNSKASSSLTINGHALSGNFSISKSDIGLSNLDNTQQLPLSYLDTDSTMSANSDSRVASQKATKTYADSKEPALTKGNLTASGAISLNTTRQVIGGDAAISIADAVADGVTKGAASFNAADFDSSSGVISLDYANGQAADATHKGFLTGTDWSTFNGKQDALGFTPVANTVTVNGYALSSSITLGKSDVGLGNLDNVQQLPLSYLDLDGTMAANSDTKVASQKALKTYADTKESAISSSTTLKYFRGDKTWQTLDTSVVTENGSLYYTNARVDSRVQGQNYAITGTWTFNTAAPQSSVTPENANDLTNKAYVDSMASGITPQAPVISLYDPTSGTPGSPTSGDRYIASATANGWTKDHIYEWNGSSWTDNTPSTGWSVYNEDTTANYGYNGSAWVLTSTMPSHNNLSGLQGGTTNQYYHLSSAQYVVVGNISGTNSGDETQSSIKTKLGAASSGVDGYITGTDWSTFNGKQDALGFTPVANTVTVNGKALSGNIVLSLASSDFANQGTTTTVLHGNASGNPSWSAVVTSDIANNNITYAKIQQIAANSILGNNTGSASNAIELNGSQVKAMLALVKGDVGLGNVENTAISTWSGTANITTLGTIASGAWHGTKIAEGYGGTNQSTYTLGDTLYASATDTLSKLAGNTTTTKKFLRQTGTGTNSAAPAWDTVTASDVGLGNVANTAQVTSVTGTSPISSSGGTTPIISIADAVADGVTKGAASFNAADFDSSSGVISLDYANGQAADATHKGFLTGTDWSTFNGKQVAGNYITALTGEVTASGPGSAVATIANDAVDFSQMQNINSQIILGRNTASSGDIEALSASTVKTILSLNNVENTALSTWAGTTNLTTAGNLSTTGLAVDTSTLYVDATNNGVGIGTTTPVGRLSIHGTEVNHDSFFGGAYGNSLNFDSEANTDTGGGYINFYGYLGGQTKYRDLFIANGKGTSFAQFDGSAGSFLVNHIGEYTASHAIVLDNHVTVEGVTSTGATGTGKFVFDTSPTLATPTLGAATGTSLSVSGDIATTAGILKNSNIRISTNTIEEYATNADNGSVNINYRGYDGGTTVFRDFHVYNGKNTAVLSVDGSTAISAFSGHLTVEGVTSTGATGTGKFVFDTSPTLTTPTLGAATATSIAIGANTLNTSEWAYLDGQNQALKTTDTPTFNSLVLNQGGDDDDILSFKSSDIGIDDSDPTAFGSIGKYSYNLGGLVLRGYGEDATTSALVLRGRLGATDPDDNVGAIRMQAYKSDGIGGSAPLGVDESILEVRNTTTTVFRVRGDGDSIFAGNIASTGATIGSLTGLISGSAGTLSAITTSAGISGILSDETGSGALVFGTSPQFTTGIGVGMARSVTGIDLNGSLRITSGISDSTNKYGYFRAMHYNTAEEDLLAIYSYVSSTANVVGIGGGSTSYNAASRISFYTAADNITTSGTERMRISESGFIGIGTAAPGSQLNLGGNITADAWTTNGIGLRYGAATYTDQSTPAGALSGVAAHLIGQPTFAFANAVTVDDAATLRISAPPAAGTNATLTNTWSLWVDNGDVRMDGGLSLGSTTTSVLGNPGAGQINATSASGSVLTLGRYDTSVTANDMLGGIQFYANDTTTVTNNYAAAIKVYGTHTIATDINPGTMVFYTTGADVGGALTESYRILNNQDLQLADGTDLVLSAATGTKIGTGTTQKIGFFNATPIVQPGSTSDIKDALVSLGLIASGGITPLDLDGGSLVTTGHATIGNGATINSTIAFNVNETSTSRSGYYYGGNFSLTASPSSTLSNTLYNEAVVNTSIWSSAQDGSVYGNLYGAVNGSVTAASSSGALASAIGAYDRMVHMGTGTLTAGYGNYSYVSTDNTNTTGSIDSAYNYYAQTYHAKTAGTITNRYGLYVNDATGAGTITNQYGIYLDNMTKGGTNYAIYSAGGNNYFGGTIRAGGYISSDGTAGKDLACASGKGITSVTFKNGLLTTATCTTNTLTDMAENYGTSDVTIEAGDVVAASSSQNASEISTPDGIASKAFVEKASSSNAGATIGIVSTNPQITLGEEIFSASENPRAVALSGRVTVKVNNQNGPIKNGDQITVSDTPGYAAKATDTSSVSLGTALEDFNGTSGKIIVFVNLSHKLSSTSVASLQSSGALKLDSLTVEGDAIFKGTIKGNDKFAGKITIPAGQTEIRVEKAWSASPISIVLTPSYNTHAWTTQIDTTGFTVKVETTSSSTDETISWIAIF